METSVGVPTCAAPALAASAIANTKLNRNERAILANIYRKSTLRGVAIKLHCSRHWKTVVIKWTSAIVLVCLLAVIARPWVSRFFNRTEVFNVCQGPDKTGCSGNEHFISCETNVVEWLKSIRPDVCVKVDTKR